MTDRPLSPDEIRKAVDVARAVYGSTGDVGQARQAAERWLKDQERE